MNGQTERVLLRRVGVALADFPVLLTLMERDFATNRDVGFTDAATMLGPSAGRGTA